jgi:hypothetical protein
MDSESLPRTVVSDDPGSKKTIKINLNDPHAMSQLLRLLEKQLDKHIDDHRYA